VSRGRRARPASGGFFTANPRHEPGNSIPVPANATPPARTETRSALSGRQTPSANGRGLCIALRPPRGLLETTQARDHQAVAATRPGSPRRLGVCHHDHQRLQPRERHRSSAGRRLPARPVRITRTAQPGPSRLRLAPAAAHMTELLAHLMARGRRWLGPKTLTEKVPSVPDVSQMGLLSCLCV
jgi:hypothetical protein